MGGTEIWNGKQDNDSRFGYLAYGIEVKQLMALIWCKSTNIFCSYRFFRDCKKCKLKNFADIQKERFKVPLK